MDMRLQNYLCTQFGDVITSYHGDQCSVVGSNVYFLCSSCLRNTVTMETQVDANCVGLNLKTKLHPMMLSDTTISWTPYWKECA